MLKSRLIQPEMLQALAAAGHGSKVLIADGNYPAATRLGPNARRVSLNLMPGVVSATQVLEALLTAVPVEGAAVMGYATTGPYAMSEDPPIWGEFRSLLKASGSDLPLQPLERDAFYAAAASEEVCLSIQTAEQRIYGNLLLTIGVVMPA